MHAYMCIRVCACVWDRNTGHTIRSCGGWCQSVTKLPREPVLIPPRCATMSLASMSRRFDDCQASFNNLVLPSRIFGCVVPANGAWPHRRNSGSLILPFLRRFRFSNVPYVPRRGHLWRAAFGKINVFDDYSLSTSSVCSKRFVATWKLWS